MSSRKNLLLIFFMVVLTLSVFLNDVWGANWIEYGRIKNGTVYYYDLDSVKKSSGKVKVWEKKMWGDKLRDKVITAMKKDNQCQDCERLSYTKTLYEIRCSGDLRRIITSTDYDTDGQVLFTSSGKIQDEWSHIVQGSIFETLKRKVCR